MSQLIGLCGSLRKASLNLALLRAATHLMPDGWDLELATLDGIPLYNGDLENQQGVPAAVTALKDRVAAAAGLVIATPEYNNSMPGVLKNGIDWLSRPPGDIPRVFHSKAVLIIGATPGGMGTALAQSAWTPRTTSSTTCDSSRAERGRKKPRPI